MVLEFVRPAMQSPRSERNSGHIFPMHLLQKFFLEIDNVLILWRAINDQNLDPLWTLTQDASAFSEKRARGPIGPPRNTNRVSAIC